MDATTTSSSVTGGTSFVILSVSIVGILAIAALLLSYYLFLTRCGLLFFWRSDHHLHIVVSREQQPSPAHCRGLQEAAIRRIPTFRYQSNQDDKSDNCAVCLADLRHGERLRLLPPCRHAFHIDCIDAWLQATANCPLCRATVSDPADTGCLDDHIVIEISSSSSSSPAAVPPEEASEQQQPTNATRSRRSLSMDSSTDKRFYLALQRMLQQQHHQQEDDAKSPAASRSRSLRRSFFSFSHSRSATILPL